MASKLIEIRKEIEGETSFTRDCRFRKIGEIPVTSDHGFKYDLKKLLTRPLVACGKSGVLFVAHTSGFCVAYVRDVVKSAKKFEKGQGSSCIQDISVTDVPVGQVSVLALYEDASVKLNVLAACVGSQINLYEVSRLLDVGSGAAFIRSITYSSCIKDMEFRPKYTTVEYVVLTSDRKLYHGAVDNEYYKDNFISFQDNVDCVSWSYNGKYLAVVRDGSIIILNSQREEKMQIKLLVNTPAVKKDGSVIAVDSIRWVRPDCIIIGCYSLCPDGNATDHMIQIIGVRKGKITNTYANPEALNFFNVFLASKEIPSGIGPYTLLTYLSNKEVAFVANKRCTNEHIVLFGWASTKENRAEVMNIASDDWLPSINLQADNDEENIVLGLDIIKLGKSVAPKLLCGKNPIQIPSCCIVVCVTVDGRLSLFQFASSFNEEVNPGQMKEQVLSPQIQRPRRPRRCLRHRPKSWSPVKPLAPAEPVFRVGSPARFRFRPRNLHQLYLLRRSSKTSNPEVLLSLDEAAAPFKILHLINGFTE